MAQGLNLSLRSSLFFSFHATGAFSQPHESVPAVIEYHRQNEIEIVGKPFVCLRNP
jgi:hypothetical protein